MSEEEIHQWLVSCFGPEEGERAWSNFENLPFEVRDDILTRCSNGGLPSPEEVHSLMSAFANGGLNTPFEMTETLKEGPINKRLAQLLARQKATGDGGTVNAQVADATRRALSEANLWLDANCNLNPASGTPDVLSREDWVNGTIDSWIKFANPVAKSVSNAFSDVIAEKFGGDQDLEVEGLYDGVMPIPMPDGVKKPEQMMSLLANTSFAMQLGYAAGDLSQEIRGSFDQGISLLKNPAGGLVPYNCIDYAKKWGLDISEVMNYLALRELAHARLFASVPWLMPRFEALIIKYAAGISIDLSAMEEQLRDIEGMSPESISGAVDLSNIARNDTEGQKQALKGLETLLALSEGWVDCVIWRAGMAHIPHIEQLREMTRRERAAGGPSEMTFQALTGLKLRPRAMREAASMWDAITNEKGIEERDAMWNHPDLLPELPDFSEDKEDNKDNKDKEDNKEDNNKVNKNNENNTSSKNSENNTNDQNNTNSQNSNNTTKKESEQTDNNDLANTNLEELSKNMLDLEDFKNSDDLEQKLKDVNWDDELSKLLASSDSDSDRENNDQNSNQDSNSDSDKDSDTDFGADSDEDSNQQKSDE
ncbi:zinc-dependent metalloprotease [Gardnerella vaginalis]|uniref:zinc-dependent metalloprotease n=1 Tax=Gardnerella vaginalis TaxID=2702 RepID=UPI0039F01F05